MSWYRGIRVERGHSSSVYLPVPIRSRPLAANSPLLSFEARTNGSRALFVCPRFLRRVSLYFAPKLALPPHSSFGFALTSMATARPGSLIVASTPAAHRQSYRYDHR
jgi:hypothetical protein